MKVKGNIHKVINMNNYINSLQNEFNIITYAESSYLYNYIDYDKMNVILCDDYDIYLFVMKDKYCLFFSGTRYEYDTLKDLNKQLYRILNILYYLEVERVQR